jgi:hypothetical protein
MISPWHPPKPISFSCAHPPSFPFRAKTAAAVNPAQGVVSDPIPGVDPGQNLIRTDRRRRRSARRSHSEYAANPPRHRSPLVYPAIPPQREPRARPGIALPLRVARTG